MKNEWEKLIRGSDKQLRRAKAWALIKIELET